MTNYSILIPNSESKLFGGDESLTYRFVSNLKKYNKFNTLQNTRDLIIEEMKRVIRDYSIEDLENFFDLKGDNLSQAISFITSIKDEECMQAIHRMKGVMFKAIDYESLSTDKREVFNESVLIFDGLFGVISPLDMIPNYRCKISTKLFGTTLSKYWAQELKGFLKYSFKNKIIIDILPQAHREMLDLENDINRVKIVFAKKDGDSFKQEGHNSKILKAELISYILDFKRISRKDLEKFKHSSGHEFSKDFSTKYQIIYLK